MSHPYTQLTLEERERIQILLWEGRSLRQIAVALCRSPSTISRELARQPKCKPRWYRPRCAHERFRKRIATRGSRARLKSDVIRGYVRDKLPLGWSPEQIAGRLALDHPGVRVSHEAIYQFIYVNTPNPWTYPADDLRKFLRRHHKRRGRRRGPFAVRKPIIPHRIGIEERPSEVAERVVQGHWEGDCMVSRKSRVALQTLEERVSGLMRISKIPCLRREAMNRATKTALSPLPEELRKTLTLDNGCENGGHEELSRELGIQVFFCRPYHSWEKGAIENTNGLIRWYLPKGTDFATVSEDRLRFIETALNQRPRKRLGYRTPGEVFKGHGVALTG